MRTRSEVLTSLASQTQFKTTFNSRVWFNFEEWWTVERRMVLLRAYNSDRTCYNYEYCLRQHREYGWIVSATGRIYDVQWMIDAHSTLLSKSGPRSLLLQCNSFSVHLNLVPLPI
ncbi:hypothetical protein C8R43DRAFT_1237625 [Mycena crocata]|nr:hypothetical protein C8R43DRAFT_1237625 [Mycena crocata]